MSGFEIAGLVSGIISMLPLAYDAITTIKNRLNDFRANTRKIAAIERSLNQISHRSQQLHRQYGSYQVHILESNASIVENDFKEIAAILEQVTKRLTRVSEIDQARLSRKKLIRILYDFTLFIRDKRTSICDETITQLNTASDRLRHISHLLVTVTSTQNISHQLRSLDIVDKDIPETQDVYKPSFFVPANPPIAKQCLDYGAMDDDGNALTSEGKLKASLLHLINKRHETPDSLPVVGAVGMSGTGKTCALRGLKAENDLRQIFQDGILFLFCGPSASEDHIKQGLCSLVSRTGGNALSQEISTIRGANAIDVIIEKAAAWFKHKKCLFLVDDIWDTAATGLALLFKLFTVVENCHTTSGLVYTTKDARIDGSDTSVRFEWLAPQNPACCSLLATAAGFSLEEIDQADQQQAFGDILTHCNGLKMALVVAGTQVRIRAARYGEHKAEAWDSYAKILNDLPRQLLTQENGEYESLVHQFSISLETLSSQESDKLSFRMPYRIEQVFESLCVAEKGQVLHDSVLHRLWGLESIQQAREVSKLLVDASLAETTFELDDGEHSEGIFVHDLVHDYADSLADQRYSDRGWIRGWEVWGLRLIECYFGAGESVVSSSQSFEKWWRTEDWSWNLVLGKDNFLQSIISRIAYHSRLQSGQTLLKHSHGIERFFDVSDPDMTWVEVCLTLRKSTVVEMHDFASTMAHEREVALSSLTSRVLSFTALFLLRLDKLLRSNEAAAKFVQERENRLSLFTSEEFDPRLRNFNSDSPHGPQKTSLTSDRVSHAYALPVNFGKYLQSSIALNWKFYDSCVEAPDIDDDEHFRLLGPPLSLQNLIEAGIGSVFVPFFQDYGSGNVISSTLAHQFRKLDHDTVIVIEPSNKDYHFITTLINKQIDDDDASSLGDHSCSRYLHLHDVGNPKDRHVLKGYTLKQIIDLWETELQEEGQ